MKTLLPVIISIVVGCQAPTFEKVSSSNIEQSRLEFAKRLTEKIMIAMSNGNYYKLTSREASSKMIGVFTEKLQKQSYKQIRGMFGAYKGHKFHELWKPEDGSPGEIYRFRGQFKSGVEMEIRTVLDGNGKLAGFFIRPWRDEI